MRLLSNPRYGVPIVLKVKSSTAAAVIAAAGLAIDVDAVNVAGAEAGFGAVNVAGPDAGFGAVNVATLPAVNVAGPDAGLLADSVAGPELGLAADSVAGPELGLLADSTAGMDGAVIWCESNPAALARAHVDTVASAKAAVPSVPLMSSVPAVHVPTRLFVTIN